VKPALLAVERWIPPFRQEQAVVTERVRRWLEEGSETSARRLLSVYASAGVTARASVAPIEDVFAGHDFEHQNEVYRRTACEAATDLATRSLASAGLRPADVSLIVSVSCTGFMIPAVDAFVADRLGMGPRLARLPVTEAGCAGGVVGLARACDYLVAHPDEVALLLAVEFSSLTFQRWDRSATNVVSTALFGDGGAAAVLVGPRHPLAPQALLRVRETGSHFFPGSTHLMGFRLRNTGLQIILDRALAGFVRREVRAAIDRFLARAGCRLQDLSAWALHPGGRRIVEAMVEQLGLRPEDLAPTEAVLREHGNMSSVTVLFVLDELLRRARPAPGSLGLLGAFGPGFAAELALLEFA